MSSEVIKIENLVVRYNSIDVLSDVSFSVGAGDYIGVVGPNGSGKSTLIKTILGLLAPSGGSVALFGQAAAEMKGREKVGYLPQKMSFFNPNFPATVRETVALGLVSQKIFPKRLDAADYEAIDNALELLNISDLKRELIGNLSGGQQQRVFIARALVNKPEALLLDEPTTALDPETRDGFFELISRLNRESGVTVLLVTHDLGTIGKFATKLLYIDKKVVFYGGFDDFCKSEEMTRFFGLSSQHLICHRHE
jgi:zinc transport system ATP-binding protein